MHKSRCFLLLSFLVLLLLLAQPAPQKLRSHPRAEQQGLTTQATHQSQAHSRQVDSACSCDFSSSADNTPPDWLVEYGEDAVELAAAGRILRTRPAIDCEGRYLAHPSSVEGFGQGVQPQEVSFLRLDGAALSVVHIP